MSNDVLFNYRLVDTIIVKVVRSVDIIVVIIYIFTSAKVFF